MILMAHNWRINGAAVSGEGPGCGVPCAISPHFLRNGVDRNGATVGTPLAGHGPEPINGAGMAHKWRNTRRAG